jgi:hypothetical protein
MSVAEWKRYGRVGGTTHAAHLFEWAKQLCTVKHSFFAAKSKTEQAKFKPAHPAGLHPSGLPFGHICPRCLKLWEARRREA